MDTDWIADRTRLRELLQHDPRASHACLARQLGRSVSWGRNWRACLRAVLDDERMLQGRSRRQVNSNGAVTMGRQRSLVGQQWSGQKVLLRLDAQQHQFEVEHK